MEDAGGMEGWIRSDQVVQGGQQTKHRVRQMTGHTRGKV